MDAKKLSFEQEQQITALLQGGKKIEAVQLCLKFTGAGLKVSKDTVDAIEKRLKKHQA